MPQQDAASRLPRLRRKTAVWLVLAVMVALALGAAAFFARPQPVRPPPALATLDASAAKGEYLADIGNCSACHSVAGKPEFAGGVKFKTPFGVVYSTNITADRKNGIGGWTFAQFHAAMRHGLRPDGRHLYPAFPYTSFAGMSDEDIASLYLYFMQTPGASQANRANAMTFPFGNRSLLRFWKRLFHDDEEFAPVAGKSDGWNRGAYLVEAVAHCGACHTPRNVLGGLKKGRALQGGTYVDQVANGAYRTWAAVDLTPGPHGLSEWSRADIVAYLRHGRNTRAIVHGPMNEVFASTRKLTERDARAIAEYLKGVPPSAERLDLSLLKSGMSRGQTVYTVHCGTCHLPDGKGDKVLGVSLRSNPIVQAADPASLVNVILYGPDLPPPPFVSGRTKMKPFGKRLSDEDVAALATYLRGSFGNNAGSVSAADVKAQR